MLADATAYRVMGVRDFAKRMQGIVRNNKPRCTFQEFCHPCVPVLTSDDRSCSVVLVLPDAAVKVCWYTSCTPDKSQYQTSKAADTVCWYTSCALRDGIACLEHDHTWSKPTCMPPP